MNFLFHLLSAVSFVPPKRRVEWNAKLCSLTRSPSHCSLLYFHNTLSYGWLRSTVGRTSVFGRRTYPVLRSSSANGWPLCG